MLRGCLVAAYQVGQARSNYDRVWNLGVGFRLLRFSELRLKLLDCRLAAA